MLFLKLFFKDFITTSYDKSIIRKRDIRNFDNHYTIHFNYYPVSINYNLVHLIPGY